MIDREGPDSTFERAKLLGNGNLSLGIRKAVKRCPLPKVKK